MASAVCALLPFVPTYAVALPGCVVLLAQGRLLAALAFFALHFAAYYIGDTVILEVGCMLDSACAPLHECGPSNAACTPVCHISAACLACAIQARSSSQLTTGSAACSPAATLQDIPGGHPYMLSLGILGGIYAFENPLQGCLLVRHAGGGGWRS